MQIFLFFGFWQFGSARAAKLIDPTRQVNYPI